jgi:hypothetical protein
MSEWGFWPRFVVAVLAVWRVTHLLAREDGPADLVFRWRARLGDGALGRGVDCFYCLSVWVAAPFALFVAGRWLDRLVTCVALSGAACLLEAVTAAVNEKSKEEVTHVVLRSETDVTGGPDCPDGDALSAGSADYSVHAGR